MFVEKTTNYETKRNSIIDGPAAPEDVYPLCRNCTVVIFVQLGNKLTKYEGHKDAQQSLLWKTDRGEYPH